MARYAWRMEDENFNGPFRGPRPQRGSQALHRHTDPFFWLERPKITKEKKFAFLSRKTAEEVFKLDRGRFVSAGFKIRRVHVEPIDYGPETQITFLDTRLPPKKKEELTA